MPPFVLTVLKYAFLTLLYLFIYFALRTVVSKDLGGRRAAKGGRANGKPKGPTTVVVRTTDGKKLGTHRLTQPLQIGRADACHIRVDDDYVSQIHARLFDRNGGWYVEDLGSTNGTFLNQQKVTGQAEVHPGDQVRVGKTIIEIKR